MQQLQLPIIPNGGTEVNPTIKVFELEGSWRYFCGINLIFEHRAEDVRSFRMFTSQLISNGECRACEIQKAFGISKSCVLRGLKKFREKGIEGFYAAKEVRGGTKFSKEVLEEAQELLNNDWSRREICELLNIKYDTLRKAIEGGRLQEPKKKQELQSSCDSLVEETVSNRSERSVKDAQASEVLGTACTRVEDRIFAALGLLNGAEIKFQACKDVSFGGVLCAIPALLENGLCKHIETLLPTLKGYYTTLQVILFLAYMSLCRIKTVEQLQYNPPGEFGKLLGLDRVPEVRCLRKKLSVLCSDNAQNKWAAQLSKDWLESNSELAGTLYVDGHVRLYHGSQTKLPRRYVSRQRLCLRGTSDYWVNDQLGQPFFVVERPIDQGLLEVLENEIVPRLLKDITKQPTKEELKNDPLLSRFVIVFDRAGYSPSFFRRMWEKHRIGCITYHKYAKELWRDEEFNEATITTAQGEKLVMKLAERGTLIGKKKDSIWVREIRKLTETQHQTSIVTTVYGKTLEQVAARMFARWSQENFFRYAIKHFGIDILSDYQIEEIPDTNTSVVNPLMRQINANHNAIKSKIVSRKAQLGQITLQQETETEQKQNLETKKNTLIQEIKLLEQEFTKIKEQRNTTPSHLKWIELTDEQKFQCLAPARKRFMDTIRMIAYRAETAMTSIIREKLARIDDARALILDLILGSIDLIPNLEQKTLHVKLHGMANPRHNAAVQHLLEHLNNAEIMFPSTDLVLSYSLNSA